MSQIGQVFSLVIKTQRVEDSLPEEDDEPLTTTSLNKKPVLPTHWDKKKRLRKTRSYIKLKSSEEILDRPLIPRTFEEVFSNQEFKESFLAYCEKSVCTELLMFMDAVKEYKQLNFSNLKDPKIKRSADKICQTFLFNQQSPYLLGMNEYEIKNKIERDVKEGKYKQNLFEELEVDIYESLQILFSKWQSELQNE
eukprot:TRINITY_DN250_c0_g1_i1.p1 TRINITY_DN250_c0_g1~~TRINITY_DN250_c0_g1_i1.p1  ORF type:complete len:195 (-),score=36.22 TRINITY_DN250_c0_g1_i1:173-757(-)